MVFGSVSKSNFFELKVSCVLRETLNSVEFYECM